MSHARRLARAALNLSGPAAILFAAGCAGPFESTEQSQALRRSVMESVAREARAAEPVGAEASPRTLTRTPGEVSFPPERMAELERMAGPASYRGVAPPESTDLLGQQSGEVTLSLEAAIGAAIENNLDVQAARLAPAISGARVIAAEAAFDWVFFGGVDWSSLDQPRVVPAINGIPVGSAVNRGQSVGFDTGVRRRLSSGGAFSVSQGLTDSDNETPGLTTFPDPANTTYLDVGLAQPLLRGFGSDVNLAEIRLARNAERDSIESLRGELIRIVTETERAYWNLHLQRQTLLIQQRLLERGVGTRDVLQGRLDFDVKPAEYSDAVARVESRRAAVIRAQNRVRAASDALKVLINDPDLTVASETLLAPSDAPVEAPIQYSFLDSVLCALERRPEIQRAILRIDDASIRQQVAENGRLPLLDLALRTRFNGLDNDVGDAYGDISDASFVDYIAGLLFEQPIGNRFAEAEFRARRLERMRAVVDYRNATQQGVLEVKTALRNVKTNYQLIEQTRASRLAAAENLRTLQVEEDTLRGLTPDFLDLKLRRQEALALAEFEEVSALVEYSNSIADLHRAAGDALERNRIQFVVPENPEDFGAPRR
ncbi:MAG: TolC family protein [Phycisphaerales bacterium]|nr:TolC family protein [Phycisphaerales bacterium]